MADHVHEKPGEHQRKKPAPATKRDDVEAQMIAKHGAEAVAARREQHAANATSRRGRRDRGDNPARTRREPIQAVPPKRRL